MFNNNENKFFFDEKICSGLLVEERVETSIKIILTSVKVPAEEIKVGYKLKLQRQKHVFNHRYCFFFTQPVCDKWK